MEKPLSVSELVLSVRHDLESHYKNISVLGEISSFKPWRSGHWYFDLKDAQALIPAVMFKGACSQVKFEVTDGLQVVVTGRVSVYPPQSKIQFIVDSMEPVGAGALALAFEQLKAKLEQEGLFDPSKKKRLPFLPRTLGLVTSPQGAALQDMLRILRQRMPGLNILLSPARVQGQGSALELAQALKRLDDLGECDVIIIGRGGGSLEDLWAFNEEVLVRAVYACKTPIISAVGHETDFGITDFVADVRCATPTHAAQTVVPDKQELLERLDVTQKRLFKLAKMAISRWQLQLANLSKRLISPKTILFQNAQRLDLLSQRLEKVMQNRLQKARERFSVAAAKLESLSPLKVLTRGFGAVYSNHQIVTKVAQVKVGDELKISLSDGDIQAKVTGK